MAEATQPDPYRTLVDKLWNDGTLGAGVRKAAKELYPNLTLPDEQIEPVVAPLKAENKALQERLDKIEKERAEERKANEETRSRQTLEQSLEAARTKYNLTADGFDKMVSRMKETSNFTDAEAAAAWVAQQTPPPKAPTPNWAPKSMNLFGTKDGRDEKFKLLHSDPMEYLDSELQEFVNNPDAYVEADRAAMNPAGW